jgi:hypothetical protein
VSIWHAGIHDHPFGMRLTALMINKRLARSSMPMSLLVDHPNVHFHYYCLGIETIAAQMHRPGQARLMNTSDSRPHDGLCVNLAAGVPEWSTDLDISSGPDWIVAGRAGGWVHLLQ